MLRQCLPGSYSVTRFGLLLVFVCTAAIAQEGLSKEFLDYMADFQTEDGEWIDPVELEMMTQVGSDNDSAKFSHKPEEDTDE